MGIDNTAGHWGAVAKALHWAIAALVFIQLPLGLFAYKRKEEMLAALDFSQVEEVTSLFHLHKSIGLVIGLLVLARLVWRVTHYVPPLSGEMPAYLQALAHGTHGALYALLLVLAASGFLIATSSAVGLDFFFLVHVPQLFTLADETREMVELVHAVCVWTISPLIVLHIAAAAFHHFALKDDTMVKMLPASLGGRGGPMRPSTD